MSHAPELSIVIVNWNGGDLIQRCVQSILSEPPGLPYEIVVVDNASTDNSAQSLRADELHARLGSARLELIVNKDNLGFGRANNQAFALSRAPLILLLNSDAEVTPGAIDALVAAVRGGERVGASAPRLVNPDGSLQVSIYRHPPTPWEILISGLRLYYLIPARLRGELLLGSFWDHLRRRRVKVLSAAAMMVKREVIDDVGGFDERFFMYGEDLEWTWRMIRAGWELIFEPASIVVHHGGGSAQKLWQKYGASRAQLEGILRFQSYCLPRWHDTANTLAACFVLKLEQTWRTLRGRPREDVELAFQAYKEHLLGRHERTSWLQG